MSVSSSSVIVALVIVLATLKRIGEDNFRTVIDPIKVNCYESVLINRNLIGVLTSVPTSRLPLGCTLPLAVTLT